VETRRQVTEEDIRRTEAHIARSYGRLKRSVARAPSRALGSVGGTVREHPMGTAAAAIVAGIAMYGLYRVMTRRRAAGEGSAGRREGGPRQDMAGEVFRMVIPLATPYIASYLGRYVGTLFSRERR